ncbi:hypothetical protein D3C81_1220510 [compost metagenome]
MHVDGTLFNVDVAAPDLIQQLATRVGALLVGHEKLQQAVFGRAHLGRTAVDGHAVADRVQQQAADFDWRLAIGRAGTAQHGLQARYQLTGGKRLGDVVVGADFQALDLVVLFTLGGEHDDRDVPGQFITLEATGQLDAGRAGQHPVEQDQVRFAVDDNGVGLLGVFRLQAVIAGHFQRNGDHFANGRFVVDDQNAPANHALILLSFNCLAPH